MSFGDGGRFQRQEGDRWVRRGTVLEAADTGWATVGLLEPTVLYVGPGDWRMWYRADGLHSEGAAPNKIGYATSLDGLAWTDHGSPILGNGTGGEAHRVICPHMRLFGSTFYLYYTDIDSDQVSCATSANGISGFTIVGDIGLSLPAGCDDFGHLEVWKEGSTYYALVDAHVTSPSYWATFLASSASPTSGWSYLNSGNQLATMRVADDGTYGAAFVDPGNVSFDGHVHAWYHASPVAGNAYSDLYRAWSVDRITWTQVGVILARSGDDYEVDQVADPCVIEVDGTAYLYYDADVASSGACAIKLATFGGALSQLVSGR